MTDKKLFDTALKNAQNGAIADVSFWLNNYEMGKCTLYTTIQEILLALGLLKSPVEVKTYERKAQKLVSEAINNLIKNENN